MRVAKQTLATEQAKAAAKEQLAQAMKDVSYAAHLNLCCQQPAFLCHADPMSIKDTIPALQAAIQEAASGCENGVALNCFNFGPWAAV